MKPSEFIKRFGIERARQIVNADHTVHALIFAIEKVSFLDLKRLVESHKLVEELGGLDGAKEVLKEILSQPKNKYKTNFEKPALMQAISDVESCQ